MDLRETVGKSSLNIEIPQNIKKFTGKDVPRENRLKAAKGIVPLSLDEQVLLLVSLVGDPDPEICKVAEQTILELPQDSVIRVLKTELHAGVLDVLSRVFVKHTEILELITMNKKTSQETILNLIKLGIASVLEVISLNQVRLMKEPEVLNSLLESPNLSRSTLERLQEFFLRHLSKSYPPQASATKPATEQKKEQKTEPVPIKEPKSVEQQQSAPAGTAESVYEYGAEAPRVLEHLEIPQDFFDIPKELTLDKETESKDEEKESILKQLQNMNVARKVKLALFGNKEVRSVLIKDSNKIVATSVLKSPKIVDSEIFMYAQSRSVSDEVIRIISTNKEWVKNYRIKTALVNNPKTPLPVAIKFVNYLTHRDLKDLSGSKNVSGALSNMARSLLQKKQG
ncbi:MAG TPA: hypothetical protein VII00_01740 [bacterium]